MINQRFHNLSNLLILLIVLISSLCVISYYTIGSNFLTYLGYCSLGLFSIVFIFNEKNSNFFYGGKIFSVAYILFFTIGVIQWIPDPHIDWAFWLQPVSLQTVLLLNVGLLCFAFGWLSIIKFKEKPPVIFTVPSEHNNKLFALMLSSLVFSIAISAFMFSKGGIPALSDNAQVARMQFADKFSQLVTVTSISCHSVIYLSIALYKNAKKMKKLLLTLGFLCSFFILFAFGGRYFVIDPAIVAILLFNFYIRPIKVKNIILVATIGLLIFSIYGNYRESQYLGVSRTQIYKQELGFPNNFSAMMVPALQYMKVPTVVLSHELEMVPNSVPYQMGSLLLHPFQEFLPGTHPTEDVWLKEKIINISFDIGVGTPGSLLSVFYGDFGWIGVIIQMFLLGLGLKLLSYFMVKMKSVQWVVVSSIMIKSALMGLFLSVFHFFINMIEPVFFLLLISASTTLLLKKKFNKKAYFALGGICLFMATILCFVWVKTGAII